MFNELGIHPWQPKETILDTVYSLIEIGLVQTIAGLIAKQMVNLQVQKLEKSSNKNTEKPRYIIQQRN